MLLKIPAPWCTHPHTTPPLECRLDSLIKWMTFLWLGYIIRQRWSEFADTIIWSLISWVWVHQKGDYLWQADLIRWALWKPTQVFAEVRDSKHQKRSSFGLEEAHCCVAGRAVSQGMVVASRREVPSFTTARNRILSANSGWAWKWSLGFRWDHSLPRP